MVQRGHGMREQGVGHGIICEGMRVYEGMAHSF